MGISSQLKGLSPVQGRLHQFAAKIGMVNFSQTIKDHDASSVLDFVRSTALGQAVESSSLELKRFSRGEPHFGQKLTDWLGKVNSLEFPNFWSNLVNTTGFASFDVAANALNGWPGR